MENFIDGIRVVVVKGVVYCFYSDYIKAKANNIHSKVVEESFYKWCDDRNIITLR